MPTYTSIVAALFFACSFAHSSEVQAPQALNGHGRSSCLLQRDARVKVSPATEASEHSPSHELLSSNTSKKAPRWASLIDFAAVAASAIAPDDRAKSWAWGAAEDIFGKDTSPSKPPAASSWNSRDKAQLALLVVFLALFDIAVLQRYTVTGLRSHLLLVGFWVCVALGYNLLIARQKGSVAAVEWLTGYVLEWLLSMDNLFVFHLIFRVYQTPKDSLHKALMFGLIGAVISRLVFFLMVSSLLSFVSWFRLVFGGFLIYSGIQAAQEEDEEDESVSDIAAVRWLRWCLGDRLIAAYEDSPSLVIWREGKLHFTLLLPVIFSVEMTDVIFALDSVSAKAAQIPDYWISTSSSILAMFGLRAMFFVVQDLVDLFDMLKYGLCFILVFIGIELMISEHVQLPPQVVLVVILAVLLLSIASSSSLRSTREGDEAPSGQGVLNSLPKNALAEEQDAGRDQDADSAKHNENKHARAG